MDKYRVNKVIGEGSFGKAILCSRIGDGKVNTWQQGLSVDTRHEKYELVQRAESLRWHRE